MTNDREEIEKIVDILDMVSDELKDNYLHLFPVCKHLSDNLVGIMDAIESLRNERSENSGGLND